MAFIPIPNGVTLCFNFTTDTSDWQFCLTLRKSAGAPTPTDLANLTLAGENWWTSDLKALTNVATTLRNVTATDQTSQGAPQDVRDVSEAGTLAGGSLPAGSCLCVSLRTAKRGRSYRGRSYLSGRGVSELVSTNFFGSTAVADVVAAFNSLQGDLDTAGFDIVVASKQHNGITTNPADTNEVIEIVADQAVDSQRRRLAGRGT